MSTFRLLLYPLLIFAACAYGYHAVPDLVMEALHQDAFVPAVGTIVTKSHCTNWNLGMHHDCDISYLDVVSEAKGTLSFAGVGPAPSGPITVLKIPGRAFYTTNVALMELGRRGVGVLLAALGIGLLSRSWIVGLRRRIVQ